MKQQPFRESTFIPDLTFPINIFFIKDIYVHWHEHMELIIVKNGRASIQVDEETEVLSKGEIAIVNARQIHHAEMLDDQSELIAIVFNEAIIRNSGLDNTESNYFSPFINKDLKLPNFIRKGRPCTEKMIESINNITNEFEEKKKGFELMIKSELYKVFALIFRNYGALEQLDKRHVKHNTLYTLFEYLRENYHQSITIDRAAEMVNLSPTHFCRVFKNMTGKTLIEYVNILRINEADQLLRNTDLTVTEIAEKIGYSGVTYFGRVFKQIKNAAPTSIRKMSKI